MNKQSYRLVSTGKSTRRDYTKVSGTLELPNLVEIQTDSYEWFLKEGIQEVFDEVYPIQNYSGNIRLKFKGYEVTKPKYSVDECKYREANYAAPLKSKMVLEIVDSATGEVILKEDDVFLGDFPLMTKSGTFIINGAERVIVSQIVRSPGAYFKVTQDDKTGRDNFQSEIIPSRGTWLEFMTDAKKPAMGRILNVSVDRKRKILSTVLFKALGMSLNGERNEDAFDAVPFRTFLKALGHKITPYEGDEREFLSIYVDLYNAFFGEYEEIKNTLVADKLRNTEEALITIYQNQRSDEVATIDGSVTLMNSKFFDPRRYDLTKAGRYKINKKLGLVTRVENQRLSEDLLATDGSVALPSGTLMKKEHRDILRESLNHGTHMTIMPFNPLFVYNDPVVVETKYKLPLVGRVLSKDVELESAFYPKGLVLTMTEIEAIAAEFDKISIMGGITSQKVKLTKENVLAVLNYGSRLFDLSRMTDGEGYDIEHQGEMIVDGFEPDESRRHLSADQEVIILDMIRSGAEIYVYLVGAACQVLHIRNAEDRIVKMLGIDPIVNKKTVMVGDIYASTSYLLNLLDGIGEEDDIDQLGNRRIRTVGELIQNQFRIGLSRMERVVKERMSISDSATLTPKSLTNIRPLTAAVKEFFSSSQLSQFMDQTNPLAELTNKRRISALGPGGLTRERAGFEVRDVHTSHYGRICPIETPEGPNIGLISNLTSYGKVNEYGFIQTPYRLVNKDGTVTSDVVYLSADEEEEYIIAQANEVVGDMLVNEEVVSRFAGETIMAKRANVELADISPKQIVSVATACIPFLENDDASRALMGANMQRQAIPLIQPHAPLVGTGIEHRVATDSGSAVICEENGIVEYVDSHKIIVSGEDSRHEYRLQKFRRANQGTSINQRPLVEIGERVAVGDVLADGPSMENGELALGQNVVIAYMTWYGYNYEDAIIMSERLVKDDVYTSIHIEEYDIECRETKLGPEEITRDIPNVSENSCRHLDARGIVMIGAEVKEGDILVGKVTPKGQSEISPEEKLLLAIFGEKSREVRDNSLKVPHGGAGIVHSIRIFKRDDGHDLPPGVNEVIKVYIVQKRKISEGDKMAGRHGNKGVISKILPIEDMPYLPDGTPIDVMLNPFGVPSRMNIGQVLEIHLGLAAMKLGEKFATPVFDGITNDELTSIMQEAGLTEDGKTTLYDGRTGEKFDERVAVGVMYMIKLSHMVDDKLHARATGPYSLVTQQPLGGKAQNGGQRFGEMEVWALEAYGAAHTLQEILTVKSDDIVGRTKTYEAIIKGNDIPTPGIPESFRVLIHELQALAIDVRMLGEDGNEVDMKKVEADEVAAMAQIESSLPIDAIDELETPITTELDEDDITDFDIVEIDEE